MDPLLMTEDLHRPLEALPADVTAVSLDRKVGAADVVAQRFRVFELHRADVADAGFPTTGYGLLNCRVQNILDHLAVARVNG